jgi:peptidoglycan/LPS O-acetylase OafA/YrhL
VQELTVQYRRELDGLRAVAVIPVVLLHAQFKLFSGGFIGVDVFFVISGYLITSIISAEKQNNTFTLAGFYERRARRIVPALLAMLLVSVPLAWLCSLPRDMNFFSQSVLAVLGFVSNVYFSHTAGYFGVGSTLNPLIHTWSLAVEEQYYILFPALLMLLWRLGPRTAYATLGAMAACSLMAAQYYAKTDPQFDFYLLPTRGWEILAGALIAFYSRHLEAAEAARRNLGQGGATAILRQSASLIGMALIAYAIFFFDDGTPFPSLYALIPVLGAVLVIVYADETTVVGKMLGLRPLVAIGSVSYSLYLFHQPVLAFARQRLLAEPDLPIVSGLLLMTLALSYASWRFIEQPFRNRNTLSRPRLFTIGACAAVCLLAIAISGWRTNGFPARFDEAEKINQQLLRTVGAERRRAVRGDVCQFNNLTDVGIDGFLKQWNCKDDSAFPHLQRIPVIITGDSHSADKVIALKLNGLLPLQIGGAGCSIIPRRMSSDCQRIYQRLHDVVANDPYYQYLVLAHLFSDSELTPDSIQETVAYWKKYNKKLVWFTAMPTFYQFAAHLERGQPARIDFRISNLSQRDGIIRILNDSGIHIVDTRHIFCSLNDCGYVSKEGCVLMTDDSHLSLWGAKLFGRALLDTDPLFSQWAGATPAVRISRDLETCHKPVV